MLQKCQSEYNTPILPVKKPQTQEYQLVKDMREINKSTVHVHPAVPNPYTLSAIPEDSVYFTMLDLKNAFFSIPLEEERQKIFTFEWESPTTVRKIQLC